MVYYSLSRYNEDMFLVGILSWWYGDGWKQRLGMTLERLVWISDYFSIGLLFKTLFAPFRQISADRINGSLSMQLRGMVDQLISRCIGFMVRLFMILLGIVVIISISIWGGVVLVMWAVVPVLPIIGLILTVIGWVPSWQ